MHLRKKSVSAIEWEPDVIRAQLSRIQSSETVRSSEVLQQFLQFVVEETLAGRMSEIKEYTIGVLALGRSPSFNPQADAIVRIHAGRLRRMLFQYYSGPGKYDPIRIEMPKGTYVPIFTSNDEPAETYSGADQLLRSGPGSLAADREGQQVDRLAPAVARHKLTIAVLPFRNQTEEQLKEIYTSSLGEQMSTELARFQDISVVSYYSTRLYALDGMDMQKVSKILGAHYVMTGSVRFSQGILRITVQLTFGQTGEQVWAMNHDQKIIPDNLQEITDEIIVKTASWVAGYYGILTREMEKASDDLRNGILGSYDAVYWYNYYQKNLSPESAERARVALEQTVLADPSYALAWAVLGELHLDRFLMEIAGREAIKTAFEFGRNAMRLDRYCTHAYQTLAKAYLLEQDREGCIAAMEECFALNRNSTDIIGWKGVCYTLLGEYDKGKELLTRAIPLNPFYPWCYPFSMALYHFHKEEYPEALVWAKKINMPALKFDIVMRMAIYSKMGNEERYAETCRELFALWPNAEKEMAGFLDTFILDKAMIRILIDAIGVGK